jgi:hypothetical protein
MPENMKVDTTALDNFYNEQIPQHLTAGILAVQEALMSQQDLVHGVTFTKNFGLDTTASLRRDTPVWTGVRVDLDEKYQITDKDRVWLHPSYAHLTALRSKGAPVIVAVPEFDSSAGTYSVHQVDPVLGVPQTHTHSIVGIHANKNVEHWFTGFTVEQAYEQCQNEDWKTQALDHEAAIATEMGSADLLHKQWTNLFQRGKTNVSYFSGCISNSKTNLVHVSPLLGYVNVSTNSPTVEANMFSRRVIDVSSLKPTGQRRLMEQCSWGGEHPCNPMVMQEALPNWQTLGGDHYEMKHATYSSCGSVIDKYAPGDLVRMTPDAKSEYDEGTDTVKVLATNRLITHLLDAKDALGLLNTTKYDGTHLKLDRHALLKAVQQSPFAFSEFGNGPR